MAKKFLSQDAAIKAVIAQWDKWNGYIEKRTNAFLKSKKKNSGSNNYTIFGKRRGCNGQPWCDAANDDMFVRAFGKKMAAALLYGFSNYTPDSAQRFKNHDRFNKKAKKGSQIFFKNSKRICHTGFVYKVDDEYVYTFEGNTAPGSTIEPNGGMITKKKYKLDNPAIAGYGHPDYSKVVNKKKEKKTIQHPVDTSNTSTTTTRPVDTSNTSTTTTKKTK